MIWFKLCLSRSETLILLDRGEFRWNRDLGCVRILVLFIFQVGAFQHLSSQLEIPKYLNALCLGRFVESDRPHLPKLSLESFECLLAGCCWTPACHHEGSSWILVDPRGFWWVTLWAYKLKGTTKRNQPTRRQADHRGLPSKGQPVLRIKCHSGVISTHWLGTLRF